jgi:hypothetical protein
MQPKGGAGKSFTSVHLIQFLREKGRTVMALDLDSSNNTLEQFRGLDATALDIQLEDNKHRVDSRKFDAILENIIAEDVSDVVMDVGASVNGPFSAHIVEIDFFSMAGDLGLAPIIHVPVSGGQGLLDNLTGLRALHDLAGNNDAKFVIWANRFFGDLELNGIPLEKSNLLKSMKDSILGIVRIPRWTSETVNADVETMMKNKVTYDEIQASDDFKIFTKSRLKKVKAEFFANIEAAGFLDTRP